MVEVNENLIEAAKALESKTEFVEALLDNIEAGIVACDAEGVLMLFNRATREFHGLPEERLPAEQWAEHYDLYLQDGVTRMQKEQVPLFRALAGEQVRDVEMVIAPRGEEAQRRVVLSSGQAIFDASGRKLGAVVAMHDITKLRQLEQERVATAQRESEDQFRILADSIPQLAWMAEADGHIFWYNRRWYDYTGTTLEEMEGWGWQKVHDPEELPHVVERWSASIQTAEPFEMSFPLRSADGEYRRFLTRVLPLRDTDGRVVRWFGTNTDVEEQLRAEERLKQSEKRFRTMIEQSPVSIQVLAPDGRTTETNRAWERLWGVTIEQLGDYNLLHDEQLKAKGIMPYIERAFAGEMQRIPPVLYDPDETIPDTSQNEDPARWTQAVVYPVKDEQGGVREVVLMHEDITERKKAEADLQASEERYRALADAMPQLVWATDENGSHFYYNQQWYDFTGLTEEESMGFGFANALHPDDTERTLKRWERAWRNGEAYTIECRFYSRPQGRYRWFLTRATPVHDASGKIYQWVGTCTDIDEQKEMETQLARMNKEREQMLEEVSTPVVPVLPGVLALPLVGSLDTQRMQRATDAALAEVSRTCAHTCIIDITGARIIDSYAVANLGNLVTALKLIGADAIVTGVTAHAAQSLVGLGLDLSQIHTRRTLAEALAAVINGHNSQGIGSRNNGTSSYTR